MRNCRCGARCMAILRFGFADSVRSTLAGGNLALYRRGGDRGQQGRVFPQRIDGSLFQHTAPLQQAHDPFGRGFDDPLHVVIGQLRGAHEGRRSICAGHVNAVGHQFAEVYVVV